MNIEIPEAHAEAAEAFGDGYAAGASAERARIAAILDADVSKDRPTVARKLAFSTDMDVEAALGVVEASAPERTKPSTPSLAERHAAAGPGAGADGVGGLDAASQERGAPSGHPGVMRRAVARAVGSTTSKKV